MSRGISKNASCAMQTFESSTQNPMCTLCEYLKLARAKYDQFSVKEEDSAITSWPQAVVVLGYWRDDLTFSPGSPFTVSSVNCLWSGDKAEREVGRKRGGEGQSILKEEGGRSRAGHKHFRL